ncbi:MAG: hypothetical protein KC448_14460 [Yoonia sp.]|nr:hypothetical protein [Yoonia sp.]
MKKTKMTAPKVDTIESLTLTQLTVFCGTDADWVIALVDHGVVEPLSQAAPEWLFSPAHIARARKASRLMRDLGLNVAGVALVLDLIEERDALARRLAILDAQIYA